MNYKQELLKTIKITDSTEIRVSKVINEEDGSVSFDLRTWFCTKKNPEMTPTQKGVRISQEDMKDLLGIIQANM